MKKKLLVLLTALVLMFTCVGIVGVSADTPANANSSQTILGTTVDEWTGPYGKGTVVGGAYKPIQYDNLTAGIASDYIGVNLKICSVNMWTAVQLAPSSNDFGWNNNGAHIKFSNSDGSLRLDIYGFGGQGIAENVILGSLSEPVLLKIELIRNAENDYVIKVGDNTYTNATYFTDANLRSADGKTFINFAKGDGSDFDVRFRGITTSADTVIASYPTITVNNTLGKYVVAGSPVTLPTATVSDAVDADLTATVTVKDGSNNEVTVTDNAFTPTTAGVYTIEYSATNSDGFNTTEKLSLFVVAADADATAPSSWWAPWGGILTDEGKVTGMIAHAGLLKPLTFGDDGYIAFDININALCGEGGEPSIATWVCFAFMPQPNYGDPAAKPENGLYVQFWNFGDKLRTSVAFKSVLGEDTIASQDTFSANSDSIGNVLIELKTYEIDGETKVKLYVNGAQCTNAYMDKVYLSDMTDKDGNFYLGYGAYDADENDAQIPNSQTRNVKINAIIDEKAVDSEAPVITVANVPTTGTVGTAVVLPNASVTDNSGEVITAVVEVKDADGKAVSVINGRFTPEKAGNYTVKYTAVDSTGNSASSDTYTIAVAAAPKTDKGGCGSSIAASSLIAILPLAFATLVMAKRKNNY